MKHKLSVSQVVDVKQLLALGEQWNRLCARTPNANGHQGGVWDLSFPWMLGWLSEIPEEHRDLLVLIAKSGSTLKGILPLLMHEGPDGRELSLIGSQGCLGDCKGILAAREDQLQVGEVFGDYLATEWIGQLSKLDFQGVSQQSVGIHALIDTLMTHAAWNARSEPIASSRFVCCPLSGPDGEPIWPLASRRTMSLVRKAFSTGFFEYSEASEATDQQKLIKHALAMRGMLKNDAPELKRRFGSIQMAQRIIDYRFAPGTKASLAKVGQLGSCNLCWKNTPIAGAMFVDYGETRNVFWMEVRVHPEQEQLIFWMLFSSLVRSSLGLGLRSIHLASPDSSRAIGFKNHADPVCSIQAFPHIDSRTRATKIEQPTSAMTIN